MSSSTKVDLDIPDEPDAGMIRVYLSNADPAKEQSIREFAAILSSVPSDKRLRFMEDVRSAAAQFVVADDGARSESVTELAERNSP